MKAHIESLLTDALQTLQQAGQLPDDLNARIQVTDTKDRMRGDLATNLAMMLAKPAAKNPLEVADMIIATLPESRQVEKAEIAGPGFINFFIHSDAITDVLDTMLESEHLSVQTAGESQTIVDGNTTPYLLYAYTRIASIFQKGNIDPENLPGDIKLEAKQETDLANQSIRFSEILTNVGERGQPHLLCTYLYELAGLFSSFYEACPVLNADHETAKNSRLKLSALTANVLHEGLQLLGIETLERM